jgi:intracellular septation protein
MGKLLLDFFPVLLFFVVFKYYDNPTEGIIAATAVAIVASIVQVAYTRIKHGRVENMHLITLALIVVLGGATIVFRNEMFIKWKPSIVNWLFAAAFLGSQFIGSKNLVQRMMDKAVELPPVIWMRLNMAWVIFFVLVGFLNVWVVYNFDTDTWVNFKLFGLLGLTILFVIAQSFYLMRHMRADDDEAKPEAGSSTDD